MSFTLDLLLFGAFVFCILLAFAFGAERERRRSSHLYHSEREVQAVAKESYNRGLKAGLEKALHGRRSPRSANGKNSDDSESPWSGPSIAVSTAFRNGLRVPFYKDATATNKISLDLN